MYNWAIWKPKVVDADIRFVHVDDLPASGFASVYQFSEADARSMEAAGTYKSFKGTVFSPVLKLDCDDTDTAARVEVRLHAMGVGFSKFSTGNRGFHYHVPREVAASHTLPALDKQFVTREFPGADVSFYHHVGMYRQVGAVHQKTGRRKEMTDNVIRPPLDMREEKATLVSPSTGAADGRADVQSVFNDAYLSRLTVPYSNGERHNRYCAIAARLDDLGQPFEWAYAYLANVNLMSETPVSDMDLMRILTWAFEQRDKR